MAADDTKHDLPDLLQGIALADLPDGGKLLGHCGGDQVLVVRRGTEIFAVDAHCTHYGGPLADGLVVNNTVRCPWHHACFDLRTGEALRAPAFRGLARWWVEQRDGRVFVVGKRKRMEPAPGGKASGADSEKIVIVGGGAAGFAAADKLRREGYQGSLTLLSNDEAPPIDRPNLSKDYLAGKAPEDWIPLRSHDFYSRNGIDLRLATDVLGIEAAARQVVLADGNRIPYDRLLLATGAEPVHPTIPGSNQPHVLTLRSLADCRAIIERARSARRAVVLGASFLGLEVAAALRARNVEVNVVAPDKRPLGRVLGAQMGDFIRALHEEHGVAFHLEDTVAGIDKTSVVLASGGILAADFVVAGIGVRPRTELAERAGLAVDRGVVVDAFLETTVPGIFAAGDIARWPDPRSDESIRVEHWVSAEMQGSAAAVNMLGRREQFVTVPFFWTQHYDVPINYVGHARQWDEIVIDGEINARDCLVRFKCKGRVLAIASIFRDTENLEAELQMERESAK
ncbi:FAD-dependent oxidoreductase [Mesorhizobium sp. BAC0120]|uniref:FAD-dependent oxidoreductase n=1 Tax=Mesorhizobium sp. BAC0120 TaxID=3090670 RepID=UPI00298CCA6C|nr:FAD-dependent oxidoreductase [Mesorhizobium sp. BAC0120]MDW6023358.1 FAD-dependent oxidoreductase [Mesorhizobium sp. BAC0120]